MKLSPYFQFLRISNLLIIIFVQYILYYLVLKKPLDSNGLNTILDHLHFGLLVICTVFIALGGYVVNDILDVETDTFNDKKNPISKNQIGLKKSWIFYYNVISIGALTALYLAIYVDQIALFFIYPISTLLLFYYSKYLKKTVLLGNLVVAFFCSGVAGIVLFSERQALSQLSVTDQTSYDYVILLFGAYMLFAFLSTMYREIIKDIEDVEGDKHVKLNTLAVKFGIQLAKYVAIIFGTTLLIALIIWCFVPINSNDRTSLLAVIFLAITPLCYSILQLNSAKNKEDFKRQSTMAKWIMLSGILLFLIYSL